MTTLKVYSSPATKDRRSEFTEFYEAAYSTIVGELLALTGGLDHARAVSAGSFSRAWQAWPAIRLLAEPESWVREDAMTRAYAPPRGMRLLQRGLPPIEPVDIDPEDDVLVAALQRLPMAQRLPLVLHYLAQIPVELIAEWTRCTPEQIEAQLDDGFDALVAVLDWPVEDAQVEGEEYDWTAEALQDCAQRLPQQITTPAPTVAFRHATAVKLTKQGAPVSVAAAACLGLVVALSLPDQQPEARPAAFNPAPEVDPFVGPTLGVAPVDTPAVEPTIISPAPSPTAPTRRPSLAARATPTMPLPVVQVAAAPVETSSSPTTSTPPALIPPALIPPATTPPVTTPPATTTTPTPTPSTVTVLVTPSTVPSSTSSTSSTATTTTEESEVETTWTRPRPSPRPRPTTTTATSDEAPPSEEETITDVLPVPTSASDD